MLRCVVLARKLPNLASVIAFSDLTFDQREREMHRLVCHTNV